MRSIRRLVVCAAVLILCAANQVQAASRQEVVNRLEDFRQFFVDFQFAPDRAVPADLLAQCHGVIIMREYKAGFVFGVRGGDGVVILHNPDTGQWSAPGFIVSAEGSFGFQIGGQSIDAIILIMNRDGIDMLLKTRFKIGVDAAAAAGPVGRDASAKVGPGTALLAYSRSKGLYAGVAFEGGAMLNYDKYNRAMYGMDVGLKEILLDGIVSVPPEAMPIIQTLANYAMVERSSPALITMESVEPIESYQSPPAAMAAPGLPELEPAQSSAPATVQSDASANAAQAAVAAHQAAFAAQQAAQAAETAAQAAAAAQTQ